QGLVARSDPAPVEDPGDRLSLVGAGVAQGCGRRVVQDDPGRPPTVVGGVARALQPARVTVDEEEAGATAGEGGGDDQLVCVGSVEHGLLGAGEGPGVTVLGGGDGLGGGRPGAAGLVVGEGQLPLA